MSRAHGLLISPRRFRTYSSELARLSLTRRPVGSRCKRSRNLVRLSERVLGASVNFRAQNCGAVSRRARNQIERKTIPNYCTLFNEFSP